MIALNQQTFARAAKKAAFVQPAVTHSGAQYFVSRADGRTATVKFTARDGSLWASCNCPAGSPDGRHIPLPCYHVAAAVLIAQFAHQPRTEHVHKCARCSTPSIYSCNCPTPNEPDLDCDCLDFAADGHRDSDFWA